MWGLYSQKRRFGFLPTQQGLFTRGKSYKIMFSVYFPIYNKKTMQLVRKYVNDISIRDTECQTIKKSKIATKRFISNLESNTYNVA